MTPLKLEPITQDLNQADELYSSPDCQQLLSMYTDFYPKIGFNFPWIGYVVIRDNRVVGSCSFVGQPQGRRVEIAYWTFKENEGQGIATFACSELLEIVQRTDPSLDVIAKTAPEYNASTRVLEKAGFVHTGIVQDDEIGDAWLWTRKSQGM